MFHNVNNLPLAISVLMFALKCCQVSQCAATDLPQLRFVAQLSVSGCALFVHDTGASDGPHLAVEPVMCVMDSLEGVLPRLDPVAQQLYVSIPVVLRDADILEQVKSLLSHLSPRSVSFASVTDIRVSAGGNASVHSVGFIWSPDEAVGSLRIRSRMDEGTFYLASEIATAQLEALDQVILSAFIMRNATQQRLDCHPIIRNRAFFDINMNRKKYGNVTQCGRLRFIRSINLENCTARVHQRLDIKGHFVIEPLLCHNISSLSSESVMYDYSRSMYYLRLDVVLEDEAALDAVRTQLADLSPRSVTFMKLWRARSIVSSSMTSRFAIGPLMVSADWKTAQLRIHCYRYSQCDGLSFAARTEPVDLWQHLKWKVTSLLSNQCTLDSTREISSRRMRASGGAVQCSSHNSCSKILTMIRAGVASFEAFCSLPDGRWFVSFQQRVSGGVSFQRTWAEYETGFGFASDFWIGLSSIHSLTAGGVTLRVEMKLWNGTELHAEYAGFQVGDASTKYVMTYREMLRDRSTVNWDALEHNNGSRFSTMDSDSDARSESCSEGYGRGGWWFNSCMHFNPNGLFPSRSSSDDAHMSWYSRRRWLPLREVRLMVRI